MAAALGGVLAAAFLTAAPALAAPVHVEAPNAPSFANVVEAVSPAVVSVRVQGDNASNGGLGLGSNPVQHFLESLKPHGSGNSGAGSEVRPVSQGSGFIISSDGYVVTNDDVVAGGDSYQVILNDGTALDAKMIGEDERTDLAVLKVDGKGRKFTYVGFADDKNVRIGDWLIAVGNPFGLGGTVTAGIVSARGRDVGAYPYDDFIQFDALVNRGDTGGPAFNLNGEVVGVTATVFSPAGGSAGIAFAIPASTVKRVASDLISNGVVKRGWLGVELQPVDRDVAESVGLPTPAGALIANVQPKTPANEAGLTAGDVVTSVNGRPVRDPHDLARVVGMLHPGDTVKLGIWRDGASKTVPVKLGSPPEIERRAGHAAAGGTPVPADADSPLGKFGLTVVPSDNGQGAVVTDVGNDSAADQRGLRPGDVILSVNGTAVHSGRDILAAISTAAKEGRKAALLRVENGARSRFVALPIDMG
ncbi:MAG TPA: Do family serine endopeptidase [Pararhizobium sp.]|nr:Do family serine endopeptidase [Pararhizobium sp.]